VYEQFGDVQWKISLYLLHSRFDGYQVNAHVAMTFSDLWPLDVSITSWRFSLRTDLILIIHKSISIVKDRQLKCLKMAAQRFL